MSRALVMCAVWLSACDDCPNAQACNEGRRPASRSLEQGIAGVGYSASDVIENGCWDCEFIEGALELWRVAPEAPRTQSEVELVIADRDADEGVEVSSRYAHALETGSYLVCTVADQRSCLFFDLAADELWTIHLRSGFKVPALDLKLFDPDGDEVEAAQFVVDL